MTADPLPPYALEFLAAFFAGGGVLHRHHDFSRYGRTWRLTGIRKRRAGSRPPLWPLVIDLSEAAARLEGVWRLRVIEGDHRHHNSNTGICGHPSLFRSRKRMDLQHFGQT